MSLSKAFAISFQSLIYIVITLLIIQPIVLFFFPGIVNHIVFQNFLRLPVTGNLSQPGDFGLKSHDRHIQIEFTKDISLGSWHISASDNIPKSEQEKKPVIFYMHGNGGSRAVFHRVQVYQILSRMGYDVVTFDYRGFGDSTGKPSEVGVVQDALYVFKHYENLIQNREFVLYGHSLGTGVATNLARKLCHWNCPKAIILDCPFNDIQEASINHPLAGLFTVHDFFLDQIKHAFIHQNIFFNNTENILHLDIDTDVLILHAEDDSIVPLHLSQKMFEGIRREQPKRNITHMTVPSGLGHKYVHLWEEFEKIIPQFLINSTAEFHPKDPETFKSRWHKDPNRKQQFRKEDF